MLEVEVLAKRRSKTVEQEEESKHLFAACSQPGLLLEPWQTYQMLSVAACNRAAYRSCDASRQHVAACLSSGWHLP